MIIWWCLSDSFVFDWTSVVCEKSTINFRWKRLERDPWDFTRQFRILLNTKKSHRRNDGLYLSLSPSQCKMRPTLSTSIINFCKCWDQRDVVSLLHAMVLSKFNGLITILGKLSFNHSSAKFQPIPSNSKWPSLPLKGFMMDEKKNKSRPMVGNYQL